MFVVSKQLPQPQRMTLYTVDIDGRRDGFKLNFYRQQKQKKIERKTTKNNHKQNSFR